MEELEKKLTAIFTQFMKEEVGQILRQFSVIGLATTVIEEVKRSFPKNTREGKDDQI